MKIYIICPVRNQTSEQGINIEQYIKELEKEHTIFYPKRDAPQESGTGYEIVESELKAIKEADEIHVFWDVNSKGSHFDLGMCYALNKKIIIKHLFNPDGQEKSYVKVIKKYNDRYSTQQPLCGSGADAPTLKPPAAASHSGKRCAKNRFQRS